MLSQEEIVRMLSENETFTGAPIETLGDLASGAVERECAAGETLIEQGVRSGDLFIAIEGEYVVLVKESDDEPEREVARLGSGQVFGEIGAVSGIGATASVRCEEKGLVVSIPDSHFHKVMVHSPRLAEAVLRSMSRYLK